MFEHFRGDGAYAKPNFLWAIQKVFFQNLHFHRTLSILGTNFRACSASGKMWTVFTCTIHAEHTRNEFYRTLSIRGTNFIACWAYSEMFKSWISRPNQIRFSKISCYRPLRLYGFGFYKKVKKKFHACVPLISRDVSLHCFIEFIRRSKKDGSRVSTSIVAWNLVGEVAARPPCRPHHLQGKISSSPPPLPLSPHSSVAPGEGRLV
jgi:hypothetical protein